MKISTIRQIFILILFSLLYQVSVAQILEKKIDVNLDNVPLKNALKVIAENGDFSYSYNPAILPQGKKVTIHTNDAPVNEVLQLALANTNLEPTLIGHHIVLKHAKLNSTTLRIEKPRENHTPKPTVVAPVSKKKTFVVSGYIFDGQTQLPVEGVKVNDSGKEHTIRTNEKGFFEFRFSVNKKPRELFFSHKKYPYDSFLIHAKKDTQLNLILFPLVVEPIQNREPEATPEIENPLSSIGLVKIMFNEEILEDTAAKSDLKISPGQLSFISPAGTHGLKAGKFINRISLNILAGYSAGVKGFELGGILNSNRHDVEGIQIAGLLNATGGSVKGVQFAGLSNVGLGTTVGIQMAGFHNHSDTIYGIQMAGMGNVMSKKFVGLQMAGALNVAQNGYGGQFAGAVNISTDTIRGIQISGLLNIGHKVKGIQIAPFNYADSLSGAAIGLFSFVRHGYHKLEITTSDLLPLMAHFRSGTHAFYNIFSIGLDPTPNQMVWGYGYGIGTSLAIKPQWRIHGEGMAYMLSDDSYQARLENLISRFQFYVRYHPLEKLGFSAGPSVNIRYIEVSQANNIIEPASPLSTIYDQEVSINTQVKAWLGWQIGIEF